MSFVRAIHHVDPVAFKANPAPGATHIDLTKGEAIDLWYRCPCGCGAIRRLAISRAYAPPAGRIGWDGSLANPTLSRPLELPCGWRGRLSLGYWEGTK